MQQQEPLNTPLLAGLAIAGGAGAVAFGVSLLVIGIEGNGSVAIGAVVALVVALILGLPLRDLPPPNTARAAAAPSPVPTPAPTPVSAPVAAAPVATPQPEPAAATVSAPAQEGTQEGIRPAALEGARDGRPDDLKRIKGVGPKLEGLLNSLGIYHFDQIASWSTDELAWIDSHLEGFYGRASRDDWVPQARILAAGGDTEFSSRQD